MTSSQIQELKTLLRQMQQEDPEFRVFGAEQHRYLLGPTLTEPELLAFEQTHGVTLPEDYRTFLAEAGNGGVRHNSPLFMGNSGAGPFYGLLTLEEAARHSNLRQPFPFTESTEALTEEAIEALINPDNFPGAPGALALCHRGSGLVCYLMVNGPAAGTIWEGREHFYPIASSFDSWYGNWKKCLKEHALPRLASEREITGMKVGMTKAEVIALCGGEWELKPWLGNRSFLIFKHLSTQFEIDEGGTLLRIIAHKIYC